MGGVWVIQSLCGVCIATIWPGAPTFYSHKLHICKYPETENLICDSS